MARGRGVSFISKNYVYTHTYSSGGRRSLIAQNFLDEKPRKERGKGRYLLLPILFHPFMSCFNIEK